MKKSAREKRRRDALNDRFMGLSALLDPGSGEELKTDKATIVTEAARVIKSLREELSTLTASLEEAVNSNAEMAKERESLIQDKIKRPLAEEILFGELAEHGGVVHIDIKGGEPSFEFETAAEVA